MRRRMCFLLHHVVVAFLFLLFLHSSSSMVVIKKKMKNRSSNNDHHKLHPDYLLTSSSSSFQQSSRRQWLFSFPAFALGSSTLSFVDKTTTTATNNYYSKAMAATIPPPPPPPSSTAAAVTTITNSDKSEEKIGQDNINNYNNNNDDDDDDDRIYRFTSGLQFRNIRVGNGPIIISRQDDNNNNSSTVVLHLQAMTRDGRILFDTRSNGSPILYSLKQQQQNQQLRSNSNRLVTPGVEDAILSRGKVITTGERVEPMREGGIRKIIVPGNLAYGHDGVSRYDAFVNIGLNYPIPRDEVILYQIEILRCLNVEVQLPGGGDVNGDGDGDGDNTTNKPLTTTIQACCIEENYPCKGPD